MIIQSPNHVSTWLLLYSQSIVVSLMFYNELFQKEKRLLVICLQHSNIIKNNDLQFLHHITKFTWYFTHKPSTNSYICSKTGWPLWLANLGVPNQPAFPSGTTKAPRENPKLLKEHWPTNFLSYLNKCLPVVLGLPAMTISTHLTLNNELNNKHLL